MISEVLNSLPTTAKERLVSTWPLGHVETAGLVFSRLLSALRRCYHEALLLQSGMSYATSRSFYNSNSKYSVQLLP